MSAYILESREHTTHECVAVDQRQDLPQKTEPDLERELEVQLFREIERGEKSALLLKESSHLPEEDCETLEASVLAGREACARIIAQNSAKVGSLANKFGNNTEQVKELISVGLVELCSGISRFDYTMGIKFGTFISTRLEKAMVEAHYEILYYGLRVGRRSVLRKTGAVPVSVSIESSIDVGGDGAVTVEDTLVDRTATPEESVIRQETYTKLRELIGMLPERERLVIEAYFGVNEYEMDDPYSLADLADFLNVTESRISQIKSAALRRLSTLAVRYGIA